MSGSDPREDSGVLPTVSSALSGVVGPLLRGIRKFETLRACLDALPPQLSGMAAPFDVKLGPAPGAGEGQPPVNTVYIYVTSPTVEAILEQRKRDLLVRINARLAAQLVEEFRYERASPARIAQQVNILTASPD